MTTIRIVGTLGAAVWSWTPAPRQNPVDLGRVPGLNPLEDGRIFPCYDLYWYLRALCWYRGEGPGEMRLQYVYVC